MSSGSPSRRTGGAAGAARGGEAGSAWGWLKAARSDRSRLSYRTLFSELIAIVLPVYLCVGLGFAWRRAGRPYDTALITELLMGVGAPALVFSSLTGLTVTGDAVARMAAGALLALSTFAVLGFALLRLLRLPAHTFLGPLVFMNAGNMGLPLCLFAFGEEGLALGTTFFATAALTHFTAGQWLWAGRLSPGEVLRTPLAWSALAAGAVLALGLPVPRWLGRTAELVGSFTIPLMQFTLGVSLSGLAVGGVPRAVLLAAVRIGMGVAVGAGLAWLLGFEGVARGVFILDCAMPVAVFNYLLAERYGRSPEEVAGLVMTSTLLAFGTIPLILAWLLR